MLDGLNLKAFGILTLALTSRFGCDQATQIQLRPQ